MLSASDRPPVLPSARTGARAPDTRQPSSRCARPTAARAYYGTVLVFRKGTARWFKGPMGLEMGPAATSYASAVCEADRATLNAAPPIKPVVAPPDLIGGPADPGLGGMKDRQSFEGAPVFECGRGSIWCTRLASRHTAHARDAVPSEKSYRVYNLGIAGLARRPHQSTRYRHESISGPLHQSGRGTPR